MEGRTPLRPCRKAMRRPTHKEGASACALCPRWVIQVAYLSGSPRGHSSFPWQEMFKIIDLPGDLVDLSHELINGLQTIRIGAGVLGH